VSDSAYARIEQTPTLRALYEQLRAQLDNLGPYEVQHRKSGLHIIAGSAFLAVRPGPDGLLLTIVTGEPLSGSRIRSVQRSAERCHNEAMITAATDFDDELTEWLTQAYLRAR